MSIRALNWAWAQNLPAAQKIVLAALAHRHNQTTGLCCPSIATLAEMTGQCERAVRYAVRELEAARIITTHRRVDGGKRHTSNAYILFGDGSVVGQDVPHGGGKKRPTAVGQDVPPGDGACDAPNKEALSRKEGEPTEKGSGRASQNDCWSVTHLGEGRA